MKTLRQTLVAVAAICCFSSAEANNSAPVPCHAPANGFYLVVEAGIIGIGQEGIIGIGQEGIIGIGQQGIIGIGQQGIIGIGEAGSCDETDPPSS